ncbi:hypothetical protein [Streptomyces sp. NPDC002403]
MNLAGRTYVGLLGGEIPIAEFELDRLQRFRLRVGRPSFVRDAFNDVVASALARGLGIVIVVVRDGESRCSGSGSDPAFLHPLLLNGGCSPEVPLPDQRNSITPVM